MNILKPRCITDKLGHATPGTVFEKNGIFYMLVSIDPVVTEKVKNMWQVDDFSKYFAMVELRTGVLTRITIHPSSKVNIHPDATLLPNKSYDLGDL